MNRTNVLHSTQGNGFIYIEAGEFSRLVHRRRVSCYRTGGDPKIATSLQNCPPYMGDNSRGLEVPILLTSSLLVTLALPETLCRQRQAPPLICAGRGRHLPWVVQAEAGTSPALGECGWRLRDTFKRIPAGPTL